MDDSDEALFAAFRGGDEDKLGRLVRRYAAPLHGFLARRTGDAALAEDLFQETWVNAIRGRESYRTERPFKTWLYTIALNVSRRARRPAAAPDPGLSAGRSGGDSPTRILERRETAAEVKRLVDALPDVQRDVFLLSEYEGLTYGEIADVLGRPVGTVKSQMHYALRQLRPGLERIWEGRP